MIIDRSIGGKISKKEKEKKKMRRMNIKLWEYGCINFLAPIMVQ
jgi:hypothetical protein